LGGVGFDHVKRDGHNSHFRERLMRPSRALNAVALVICLVLSGSAAAQQGIEARSTAADHIRKPAASLASASTGAFAPTARQSSDTARKAKTYPYFIEFRARYALSYGHTYAVHGRVGQKITKKDVIGLHPATESSLPWMIGHLIPVISETGASDGDAEEEYVSARYRILLTADEYAKLKTFMNQLKSRSVFWHAAIYNCNKFLGDIANHVGLETPSHFSYPKDFINEMRSLNMGRSRVAANAPLYQ
jgi:hypothetical protein